MGQFLRWGFVGEVAKAKKPAECAMDPLSFRQQRVLSLSLRQQQVLRLQRFQLQHQRFSWHPQSTHQFSIRRVPLLEPQLQHFSAALEAAALQHSCGSNSFCDIAAFASAFIYIRQAGTCW